MWKLVIFAPMKHRQALEQLLHEYIKELDRLREFEQHYTSKRMDESLSEGDRVHWLAQERLFQGRANSLEGVVNDLIFILGPVEYVGKGYGLVHNAE